MLPGRRADNGSIFVVQGPAPVGALMEGGIAVTPLGAIYISELATSFSPIDLFQNNEQGAWYDPSDLTMMFQDSAGTVPVTADGQPVGLILDKSKGLALGPELVDTANTAAGWTPYGTNTVVQDGSAVKITYVGGTDSQFGAVLWLRESGGLSADMVAGKTYKITMEAMVNGGETTLKFADSVATVAVPVINQNTYSTITMNAYKAAADPYIVFNGDFSSGEVVWIRNISVKEIAGNHASQATAAARPLLAATGICDWTNYDGVDDVLNTTFPSSLGSSCTVARANIGGAPTILTAQTIGTSYADSTDNAGLIIIDRALSPQETSDTTTWLTAKGATS